VRNGISFHCDQGSLLHADVEGLIKHFADLRVENRHSTLRHEAHSPPCVNANLFDKSQVVFSHMVTLLSPFLPFVLLETNLQRVASPELNIYSLQ
jgi:hypothetical protein